MKFDILTIFPHILDSYIQESIIKKAIEKQLLEIKTHDIRKYTKDKHGKVDDLPYGGGAGMVMTPQPLHDCIQAAKKENKGPIIYLSPKGETLTQAKAEKLYKKIKNTGAILLAGRYEGIDQRIIDKEVDIEISIGKYILTGGELPAMVLIDVLTRLIPGVLGNNESAEEESYSKTLNRKKEYPHYTRPEKFMNLKVPKTLLSGHHKKIKEWRKNNLK